MKKSVLALALAFGVTTAFAQDLTSKKGEPILPEAGDYGIAVDATPFLTYAQGIFGKTSTTAPIGWNFLTNNQTITGRYFKDEKTVFRGAIRLGFGSQTWKNNINADVATPATPPAKVVDTKKTSYNGIGLSAGIEKRKGKTRLQGYYGAEIGFYMSGSKSKYTYGNAFSSTNSYNPTSTDFSSPATGGGYNALTTGVGRTTASKAGSTLSIGARAFIGVEYFIAPKMSLGGEFGWGISFTRTGEGTTTNEDLNTSGTGSVQNTYKVAGSSKFALDTDNNNTVFGSAASLRFNFYF
ncbi:MAG: hypothetical protein ACXVC6_11775 [Bacteroidia bacterium]